MVIVTRCKLGSKCYKAYQGPWNSHTLPYGFRLWRPMTSKFEVLLGCIATQGGQLMVWII